MYKLLTPVLFLFCISTEAKVVSSAANGFAIKIERIVKSTPEEAYQQFLNVGDWWNSDHTWFGDASKLYIKPKVNGCFCEIDGTNEALHMTVSYVKPNEEIRMIGGLGPLQMLGIHGGMSWKFEEADNKQTKITFSYQVTGYMDGGLDKLAPIVNKVQSIQLDGLAAKLNK